MTAAYHDAIDRREARERAYSSFIASETQEDHDAAITRHNAQMDIEKLQARILEKREFKAVYPGYKWLVEEIDNWIIWAEAEIVRLRAKAAQ
jgi:hypothetical protein